MRMRMRIDIANYLNGYINLINNIQEICEKYENEDYEECGEQLYDDIQSVGISGVEDVGAQIIAQYLEDIADRSIELNDKKLIEYCQGLHLLREKDEISNV